MNWKWLSEFRDFALKGNVVDLAVGVIIGAAFGKIVSALVENVLMPPIGFLLNGVDFKDLAINMGTAQTPVLIKYGVFLQTADRLRHHRLRAVPGHQGDDHVEEALREERGRRASKADAVRDLSQGDPRRAGEEVREGVRPLANGFSVYQQRWRRGV